MRSSQKTRTRAISDATRGQALLEYVLLLVIVIGISVMTQRVLTSRLKTFWFQLGKEIASACKDCATPPGFE